MGIEFRLMLSAEKAALSRSLRRQRLCRIWVTSERRPSVAGPSGPEPFQRRLLHRSVVELDADHPDHNLLLSLAHQEVQGQPLLPRAGQFVHAQLPHCTGSAAKGIDVYAA